MQDQVVNAINSNAQTDSISVNMQEGTITVSMNAILQFMQSKQYVPNCNVCGSDDVIRYGFTYKSKRRFKCKSCNASFLFEK